MRKTYFIFTRSYAKKCMSVVCAHADKFHLDRILLVPWKM